MDNVRLTVGPIPQPKPTPPAKKRGKHVIFLGAGASLGSGYPLADRLALLLSSPRALTEYILDRFKDELEPRDVASSRFTNVYNAIIRQREKFKEPLEFFRSGGFATVDEFCELARGEHRAEVNAVKAYLRLVLLMASPELTFYKSEYYKFVRRLFEDDLKTPRHDLAVLTYNYDPYLEFLIQRFWTVRNKVAKKGFSAACPAELLSGFCPQFELLAGRRSFAFLKLHGAVGFVGHYGQTAPETFDPSPFLTEDRDFANEALKLTWNHPGPIVFPWEIFNEDGSLVPRKECSWNFKLDGLANWYNPLKPDFYTLFADVWERAREEVQAADKVSFVGMSFHPYLRRGFEFLFQRKSQPFSLQCANPDFEKVSFKTDKNRTVISGECSATRIRAEVQRICSNTKVLVNSLYGTIGSFSDFIATQMDPFEVNGRPGRDGETRMKVEG